MDEDNGGGDVGETEVVEVVEVVEAVILEEKLELDDEEVVPRTVVLVIEVVVDKGAVDVEVEPVLEVEWVE